MVWAMHSLPSSDPGFSYMNETILTDVEGFNNWAQQAQSGLCVITPSNKESQNQRHCFPLLSFYLSFDCDGRKIINTHETKR